MAEITNNEIRAVHMLRRLTDAVIEADGKMTAKLLTAIEMSQKILVEIEIERAWQEHELQYPYEVSA